MALSAAAPSHTAEIGRASTVAFLWHGDRNIGGGEYGICSLARSLGPDFRPILLYSHDNPLVAQYTREQIQTERIVLSPAITGVYRDSIGVNPIRLVVYAWHCLKAVVRVVRMIKQHRIGILHPVDNLSKLVGGIAGRLAGVKVVAHCRDELKQTRVDRLLVRFQTVFMHRIITVADRIRELFLRAGCPPNKVVTIHNGVDTRVFDPARVHIAADVDWSACQGKTVLGIIAMFDRCKGHWYLFQACARLKHLGVDNWHCLVVGDGREREAISREVNDLGLTKEVVFLGYRRNVAEILKGIDVVVIPSEQEAFPRVALEAMAMEVPVVASSVGGLPEAVEQGVTGILVPPRDIEALANALRELIGKPERRREMGQRGRQRVERLFSLEENVRRTKQVYREVLGLTGPVG